MGVTAGLELLQIADQRVGLFAQPARAASTPALSASRSV